MAPKVQSGIEKILNQPGMGYVYLIVLIKYNDWMMKGIEAQFIAPQWLDVEKKT